MPWEPKPGAPATFDLGEQLVALVTGDAEWGWLAAWAPSFGVADNVTATFCAQGPPDFEFDPLVLLPVAGRTPIETFINLAARIQTVRHLAEQRVFAAYCQSASTTGLWVTYGTYCGAYHDPYPPYNKWDSGTHPVPTGATQAKVTYYGTDQTGGNTWSGRMMFWSDAGESANRSDLPGADTWHPANGASWTYGPWTLPSTAHYWRAALVGDNNVQPNGCIVVDFNASDGGDYTPPDPSPPTGYVAPVSKTYDTIADLGRELDAQELKLDLIGSALRFLTSLMDIPPNATDDEPVPVDPDAPIDVKGAAGIIVDLAGIPPSAGEDFGVPVRIHRVGRIDLGTDTAWFESVELTHAPMVIQPLPLGTTRVQVNCKPPVVATVLILKKPK